MPITHAFDEINRIVWARGSGQLTAEDVVDVLHDLHTEPRAATLRAIFDLDDVESVQDGMYFSDIASIARQAPFVGRQSQLAIVAPADFQFGAARMYAQLAGRLDGVRVFRTMKEAKEWLGIV
jgi:hypothetical protein